MPPKKRGRPASSASTAQSPAKRVRVGETSVIGPSTISEATESGRPKRSLGEPSYTTTRSKAPNPQENSNKAATSTLKPSTGNQPNVRRKRKSGSKLFYKRRQSVNTEVKAEAEAETAKPKRGRPPKAAKETAKASVSNEQVDTVKKAAKAEKVAGRGRGRPKKDVKDLKDLKSGKTSDAKRKTPKVRAGRAKEKEAKAAAGDIVDDLPDGISTEVDEDDETLTDDSGRQYWLMKAEPESRMENGIDMKFSIDDLKERNGPEPWEGVRNYAARNHMRAMRVGDLAFFYLSNCKVPGIAGVMEIVREHSVDETAFEAAHPYYDAKSSWENPKWDLVHVVFRRKFGQLVKLSELKSFAEPGGVLEKMQLLKQSRLSVSAVKAKEWKFILSLAGEEEGGESVEEDEAFAHGHVEGDVDVEEESTERINGVEEDGSSMVFEHLGDGEAAVDGDLDENGSEDGDEDGGEDEDGVGDQGVDADEGAVDGNE